MNTISNAHDSRTLFRLVLNTYRYRHTFYTKSLLSHTDFFKFPNLFHA